MNIHLRETRGEERKKLSRCDRISHARNLFESGSYVQLGYLGNNYGLIRSEGGCGIE